MEEHPVALLRARLTDEFAEDLPAGVHPVLRWCGDPQFFPGATGLLAAPSWDDVVPASCGVSDQLLPAPRRGVLVLGNYQATLASYDRLLDGSIGGFPTTWRGLGQLLASVPPRDVFLTNAYIGLPDLRKDTAPFPTTPAFTTRCQELLATEIGLFMPRLVVCLGVAAARMLAAITEALSMWSPWPGYGELRALGSQTVGSCRVGDVSFIAIAVQHPSAVLASADRQRDAAVVAAAAGSTSAG